MKKKYFQPQIENTTLSLLISVMSGNGGAEGANNDMEEVGSGWAPARTLYI